MADHRGEVTEELIEFSTSGLDPARQFWGPVAAGSVDGHGFGVDVSGLPNSNLSGQYLWHPILLAQAAVPRGGSAILRSIRQFASIGATVNHEDAGNVYRRPVELEVTSPAWQFPLGGLRWHLTKRQGATAYPQDFTAGEGVCGLGKFYDLRFPWRSADSTYRAQLKGGEVLELWAEVLQPPASTAELRLISTEGVGSPEDAFLATYPRAVWRRLAGALVLEVFP